jgi:hypothetical protein
MECVGTPGIHHGGSQRKHRGGHTELLVPGRVPMRRPWGESASAGPWSPPPPPPPARPRHRAPSRGSPEDEQRGRLLQQARRGTEAAGRWQLPIRRLVGEARGEVLRALGVARSAPRRHGGHTELLVPGRVPRGRPWGVSLSVGRGASRRRGLCGGPPPVGDTSKVDHAEVWVEEASRSSVGASVCPQCVLRALSDPPGVRGNSRVAVSHDGPPVSASRPRCDEATVAGPT